VQHPPYVIDEKNDGFLSTSQLYRDSWYLRRGHWGKYLLALFIGTMAVTGMVRLPSWHWVLPLVTAPVAIYANYRTRRVTDLHSAFVYVAVVLVASVGGLALLLWSSAHHQ
jgi:hypothetical protein